MKKYQSGKSRVAMAFFICPLVLCFTLLAFSSTLKNNKETKTSIDDVVKTSSIADNHHSDAFQKVEPKNIQNTESTVSKKDNQAEPLKSVTKKAKAAQKRTNVVTVKKTGSKKSSVKPVKTLNLSKISPVDNFKKLNKLERETVASVFNHYDTYLKTGNEEDLFFETKLKTEDEFLAVVDYFAVDYFYFYTDCLDIFNFQIVSMNNVVESSSITLNAEKFKSALVKKEFVDKKISAVIKEFNSGSEKELVNQISDYIISNYTYDKNYSSAYDTMINKHGNCNGLSLMFKAFCDKLGIKADIYVGNDLSHAWNGVKIENVGYRYFDFAYYFGNNNNKYLNSEKTSHHPELKNSYSGCLY